MYLKPDLRFRVPPCQHLFYLISNVSPNCSTTFGNPSRMTCDAQHTLASERKTFWANLYSTLGGRSLVRGTITLYNKTRILNLIKSQRRNLLHWKKRANSDANVCILGGRKVKHCCKVVQMWRFVLLQISVWWSCKRCHAERVKAWLFVTLIGGLALLDGMT